LIDSGERMSKKSVVHIWPQREKEEGCIKISAIIEKPDGTKQELWYATPNKTYLPHQSDCRSFAIGSLFVGMASGANLYIHGSVPPSLLRNLEELSHVWHRWKPNRYKPISLFADEEKEILDKKEDRYLVAFSGGVDSHFTLYRHAKALCGRWRRPVGAALMVHGFDIPLEKTEEWENAFLAAKESCGDLNLRLLQVHTNWRKLGIDWEDGFGSGLASSLSLFSYSFRGAIIASDETYDFFLPWGSTPLIIPMFSSNDFDFVNDGAGLTRVQRAAVVDSWPVGKKNLRVCWEGPEKDRNCCECEKCIRTILNFRVTSGKLPPCFAKDVNLKQIRTVQIRNKVQWTYFNDILESAEINGNRSEAWVIALRKRLQHYEIERFLKIFNEQVRKTALILREILSSAISKVYGSIKSLRSV